MNLQNIRLTLKKIGLDLFTALEFQRIFGLSAAAAAVKLTRYKQRGYLACPKRGIYYFPDDPPDLYRIANRLYQPSYVSLESVLAEANIIPEMVYAITSVTTRATRRFADERMTYSFTKIKKQAFTGYRKKDGALVAIPEKALADYLYLVARGQKTLNDRLDLKDIKKTELFRYAALFHEPRLKPVIRTVFPHSL